MIKVSKEAPPTTFPDGLIRHLSVPHPEPGDYSRPNRQSCRLVPALLDCVEGGLRAVDVLIVNTLQ